MKAKIVRLFLQALENRQRLWSSGTPWDYVQRQTNQNVHLWLDRSISDIRRWVIVGGHLGTEIPEILSRYPEVAIDVFECSPRYLGQLQSTFVGERRVSVIGKAVSSAAGMSTFHETTLNGSGSLLTLGRHSALFKSKPAETYQVETTTLDTHFIEEEIDVLQIDVQGAEQLVLAGGVTTLMRTNAILIEVAIEPNLYTESVTWTDLNRSLESQGFNLVLFGVDPNLTGNALFVKSKR